MNLAGFYDESISNGLGWRAVIFVSGCPHHCAGCHNKMAQDFNYGSEFKKEEIIERIKENYSQHQNNINKKTKKQKSKKHIK